LHSPRVRDAASLILVRGAAADPRVLLGRRPASSRFAPGMYVFPGGAVQPEDRIANAAGELRASCVARMGVRGDAGRAAALANAAVRETLEETGLMVGAPGDAGDFGELTEPGWRMVRATGLRPALGALTYLGRAATPTGMPLRFNARFFTAPAAAGTLYVRLTVTDSRGPSSANICQAFEISDRPTEDPATINAPATTMMVDEETVVTLSGEAVFAAGQTPISHSLTLEWTQVAAASPTALAFPDPGMDAGRGRQPDRGRGGEWRSRRRLRPGRA